MWIFLLIVCVTGCAPEEYPSISVDPSLLEASTEAFIPHAGPGPFDTYLAVTLPYEPARRVRHQAERLFSVELNHRGEAHITVITPVEYQRVAPTLDIAKIHDLVSATIQLSPFEILCLGRATATLESRLESTFFLVIRAPGLRQLRHRIKDEFVEAGGDPAAFDPDAYFPHVTLGFTSRDLHERDGAVKDESACVARIRLAGRLR